VDTVRSLLRKAGVHEEYLRCGTHDPVDDTTRRALLCAGEPARPVHNNCSGKHAGMLATAQHLGAPLDRYLDLAHPVQQQILTNMELLTDTPRDEFVIGVDGCGAPTHGLPLRAMATAYARFAAGALPGELGGAAKRLGDAMAACPDHVSGTGSFNSVLLSVAGGSLVAKDGAEALFCVGHRERGLGLAVKVGDGSGRGLTAVVIRALTGLKWLDLAQLRALDAFIQPPVKNCHGDTVGEVRAVFQL
jgi:L-asparaginase II